MYLVTTRWEELLRHWIEDTQKSGSDPFLRTSRGHRGETKSPHNWGRRAVPSQGAGVGKRAVETDILALKEPGRTQDFPAEKPQCLPVRAQPLARRGGLGTAALGRPASPLCARAGPRSPAWGWMACSSQPICSRGWSGRKPSPGMNGALFAASRAPLEARPGTTEAVCDRHGNEPRALPLQRPGMLASRKGALAGDPLPRL